MDMKCLETGPFCCDISSFKFYIIELENLYKKKRRLLYTKNDANII